MSLNADGFDVRSLAVTYRTGALIGMHQHSWGQLVFASSGIMRVRTAAAAWLIPPTRAIWLPARHRHSIAISGEVAMRTLYIADSRAGPLPDTPSVRQVAPLLRELIRHILSIGMLATDRAEHDRLAGLLIDLLLQAPAEDLSLPYPSDARACRLADHIHATPGDPRDLGELARLAGASLRTMQRLFPRETGLTIEVWRQKARLLHAIPGLLARTSVTEVALDCGYNSPAAFSAAFASQFGVTPGRYLASVRSDRAK